MVIKASDRVNPNRVVGGVQRASDRFPVVSTPPSWTPDQISTGPWYDLTDNVNGLTLIGNNAQTIIDKSPAANNITQSTASLQGVYDATEQAVQLTVSTQLGITSSFTFDSVIMVVQYSDGLAGFFSQNATAIRNVQSNGRIQGASGTANWRDVTSVPIMTSTARKNGGVSSTAALPMPKAVLRFTFPQETGQVALLHHEQVANWGFAGFAYEAIFPVAGETTDNIERIEWYLANKHGLTLDSGHTYATTAPT